jgi:division/cell wall cluster transcriptional repressor MraZ
MLKFLGASRQKMDDRGRFHLPVRWAEQVSEGQELVITAGPSGSLLLLELEAWKETAERIGFDLLCDSRRRRLRELFVGHAEMVHVDKNSRVLIADALRTYAGLKDLNAVYLIGAGSAVSIWPQVRWEAEASAAIAEPQLFDLHTPGPAGPGGETVAVSAS